MDLFFRTNLPRLRRDIVTPRKRRGIPILVGDLGRSLRSYKLPRRRPVFDDIDLVGGKGARPRQRTGVSRYKSAEFVDPISTGNEGSAQGGRT